MMSISEGLPGGPRPPPSPAWPGQLPPGPAVSSLLCVAPLIHLVGLFDLLWEKLCREEACISQLQLANKTR